MDARSILKVDYLDILFDNRNKKYGAYILRKKYEIRLWVALIVTIFLVTSAIWFLKSVPEETSTSVLNIKSVVLQNIEEAKPTPPPQPPLKQEKPAPPKVGKITSS